MFNRQLDRCVQLQDEKFIQEYFHKSSCITRSKRDSRFCMQHRSARLLNFKRTSGVFISLSICRTALSLTFMQICFVNLRAKKGNIHPRDDFLPTVCINLERFRRLKCPLNTQQSFRLRINQKTVSP